MNLDGLDKQQLDQMILLIFDLLDDEGKLAMVHRVRELVAEKRRRDCAKDRPT